MPKGDSDISLSLSEAEVEDLEGGEGELPVSTMDSQRGTEISEVDNEGWKSDSEDDGDLFYQPTKMTARQLAKQAADEAVDDYADEDATPRAPIQRKLTEEELLKRSEKSRRRKMQRDQQLEESKTETIQKLLQKQSTRSRKMAAVDAATAESVMLVGNSTPDANVILPTANRIVYRNDSQLGPLIILGSKVSFEPQPAGNIKTRDLQLCGVQGCKNPKRYTHSKLHIPICSLSCYRKVK